MSSVQTNGIFEIDLLLSDKNDWHPPPPITAQQSLQLSSNTKRKLTPLRRGGSSDSKNEVKGSKPDNAPGADSEIGPLTKDNKVAENKSLKDEVKSEDRKDYKPDILDNKMEDGNKEKNKPRDDRKGRRDDKPVRYGRSAGGGVGKYYEAGSRGGTRGGRSRGGDYQGSGPRGQAEKKAPRFEKHDAEKHVDNKDVKAQDNMNNKKVLATMFN